MIADLLVIRLVEWALKDARWIGAKRRAFGYHYSSVGNRHVYYEFDEIPKVVIPHTYGYEVRGYMNQLWGFKTIYHGSDNRYMGMEPFHLNVITLHEYWVE